MYYPPDTYEEWMMAAMAGNGCTECLASTHTADTCPENDPEVHIKWAIDDEIDAAEDGTMVMFPTYEERMS
jgi:hypothetical protein